MSMMNYETSAFCINLDTCTWTPATAASQCDTPTSSTDVEEKTAERGGRCIRDINEDDLFWRHCFDPSNDRANQYWPHYRDTISKPDKKQSKITMDHTSRCHKNATKRKKRSLYTGHYLTWPKA